MGYRHTHVAYGTPTLSSLRCVLPRRCTARGKDPADDAQARCDVSVCTTNAIFFWLTSCERDMLTQFVNGSSTSTELSALDFKQQ